MAENKRFVSYIYLYEDGIKLKNVGFAKVDVRDGAVKMDIRIRGLFPAGGEPEKAYVFQREGDNLLGIFIGNMEMKQGNSELTITTKEDDVMDSGIPFSELGGIVITTRNPSVYASGWDDAPVWVKNFSVHNSENRKKTEGTEQKNVKPVMPERNMAENEQMQTEEPADVSGIERAMINKEQVQPVQYENEMMDEEQPQREEQNRESMEDEQSRPVEPDMENVEQERVYPADPKRKVMEMRHVMPTVPERGTMGEDQPDQFRREAVENPQVQPIERERENRAEPQEQQQTQPEPVISEQEVESEVKETEKSQPESEIQEQDIPEEEKTPVNQTPRRPVNCPRKNRGQQNAPKSFDDLKLCYPSIRPFEDEENQECLKIQPKDLVQLPKKEWILGNNSFLLHGYYNYQYLLLARFGGNVILGVPGNFYNREKMMAEMFGFPNFKPVQPGQVKEGDFGYWYRLL